MKRDAQIRVPHPICASFVLKKAEMMDNKKITRHFRASGKEFIIKKLPITSTLIKDKNATSQKGKKSAGPLAGDFKKENNVALSQQKYVHNLRSIT